MSQQEDFIATIGPFCQKYAKKYGFKVASPAIAQACLESGYGTSPKAKHHNYFGLKYRPGRVFCNTGYFEDGGSEQNKDGSYTLLPSSTAWYNFDNMKKIRFQIAFCFFKEGRRDLKQLMRNYLKMLKEI